LLLTVFIKVVLFFVNVAKVLTKYNFISFKVLYFQNLKFTLINFFNFFFKKIKNLIIFIKVFYLISEQLLFFKAIYGQCSLFLQKNVLYCLFFKNPIFILRSNFKQNYCWLLLKRYKTKYNNKILKTFYIKNLYQNVIHFNFKPIFPKFYLKSVIIYSLNKLKQNVILILSSKKNIFLYNKKKHNQILVRPVLNKFNIFSLKRVIYTKNKYKKLIFYLKLIKKNQNKICKKFFNSINVGLQLNPTLKFRVLFNFYTFKNDKLKLF